MVCGFRICEISGLMEVSNGLYMALCKKKKTHIYIYCVGHVGWRCSDTRDTTCCFLAEHSTHFVLCLTVSVVLFFLIAKYFAVRCGLVQGSEAVDIKEGSVQNLIQYNEVYGQVDSESGGKYLTAAPSSTWL